ncbi:conserved hypothetical protein [Cyanobium sp. PCC 7001]|nr:conserved hypothetical protein [Cyanobium sp. PCC 7001]
MLNPAWTQNGARCPAAMLATLGGVLALVAGLIVLLLPVVATELSRPRDSAWGAVVLLLGLVLVTSAERLMGAPMLGVLCGGLLIGRLGLEVGQSRWRALSPEEQQRLWSKERWQASLSELAASLGRLLELTSGAAGAALDWLRQRRQPRATTKRWVRQELPAEPPADAPAEASADPLAEPAAADPVPADPAAVGADPDTGAKPAAATPPVVVTSLEGVEALLQADADPDAASDAAEESEPSEGKPLAQAPDGGETG